MRKLSIILAAAAVSVLAFSCKKDDTTETNPSLTGIRMSSAPAYVAKGETLKLTVTVSGIQISKGTYDAGKTGLWWQVNSAKKDTVTTSISGKPSFDLTYRADTLGTYTLLACAFYADNAAYSTSASTTFKAIDPKTALKGVPAPPATGYGSKVIGGNTWMTENLHEGGSGLPYNGCEVMNTVFGRYYTYEEALTACPAGWHLPSAAEWDSLGNDAGALMADATFLGSPLWAYNTSVVVTNSTGFSAISAGYIDKTVPDAPVAGEKEYAAFWTADKTGDLASYRYLFVSDPVVRKGEGSTTSLALSVRCVK